MSGRTRAWCVREVDDTREDAFRVAGLKVINFGRALKLPQGGFKHPGNACAVPQTN